MRLILVLFALCLLWNGPAEAGMPEARETARINNCTPKKIEIYQQTLGMAGSVIYHIDCDVPKETNPKAPPAISAILVQCQTGLCQMMQQIHEDKK